MNNKIEKLKKGLSLLTTLTVLSTGGCSKKEEEENTNYTIDNYEVALQDTKEVLPTENIAIDENLFKERDHHYNLLEDDNSSKEIIFNNTDYVPNTEILNKLNNYIKDFNGDSSFYVVSLNDGMSFGYNIDKTYWSASTIKSAYCLYACKEIAKGNASFDEMLTMKSKHNSNGSGVLQYKPVNTSYSIKDVIFYTLDVSDNRGYHMLNDRFGKQGFNDMLTELGCNNLYIPSYSRFADIDARSFALVWQEIYNYKDKCPEGEFLWNTLLNAQYSYIKKGIPNIPSAHKSGWVADVSHDTGVVLAENPYIIITLTKNNGAYPGKQQIKYLSESINDMMDDYSLYLKNNYNKTYTEKGLTYIKK